MTGIQRTAPPPTFTQIQQQFGNDRTAQDHNIRFQDGRGLYVSNKVSLASIKAFFGFGEQLQARQAKRDAGVQEILHSIDAEFGGGMGQRALQRLQRNGIDLTHGVKGSDLGRLAQAIRLEQRDDQEAARRLVESQRDGRTQEARAAWHTPEGQIAVQTALDHHDLAAVESHGSGTAFLSYFKDNFDVCSSPAFFKATTAQVNADHIGCGLSIAVLDRIVQNGTITPRDIADLQRSLGPYQSDPVDMLQVSAPPQVPDLSGPLTNDKLDQLASLVLDRYVEGDGQWELNLAGGEKDQFVDSFRNATGGTVGTGMERLGILKEALTAAVGSQGMAPGAVSGALRAMQA